mgnify:CR=1 FL=1
MTYPITRLRRLRQNETLRNMVEETIVRPADLVMPLFACPGTKVKNPIKSMPGNYQLSVDMMVEYCKDLYQKGVKSILLLVRIAFAYCETASFNQLLLQINCHKTIRYFPNYNFALIISYLLL